MQSAAGSSADVALKFVFCNSSHFTESWADITLGLLSIWEHFQRCRECYDTSRAALPPVSV